MSWLRKPGLSKPAIFSSNRTGQQTTASGKTTANSNDTTANCSSSTNLYDSSTNAQAAISPSTLGTTSAINTTNGVTNASTSDGSSTLNCRTLDFKRMAPESTQCVSSTAATSTTANNSNDGGGGGGGLSSFATGIFNGAGVSLRRDTNNHSTTTPHQQQQQQQHHIQSTMSLLLPSTSAAFASGSFFLPGRRRATSNSMVTSNCLTKSSNLIDSQAALDSFKTHWFQAWDVMKRKCIPPPGSTSIISSSTSTRSSNVKSKKKNVEATESDLPFSSTSNGIQVGQNETNASSSPQDSSFIQFNSSNSHKSVITSDDVTSIINHLDQMIQLLIQESKGLTSTSTSTTMSNSSASNVHSLNSSSSLNEASLHGTTATNTGECDSILTVDTSNSLNSDPLVTQSMVSPLLDCLLFESMLDKLLTWSVDAGEFASIMKLHQLKLYHILVTQVCPTKALLTKPIIRPMMQLLLTCSDCLPVEVEKAFVTLLNALCQLLCQNEHLIDLFFIQNPEENSHFVNDDRVSCKGDGNVNCSDSESACDNEKDAVCHESSSSKNKSSNCNYYKSKLKSDLNNGTHHLSYISPTIKPSEYSSPQIRAKIAWISDKPEARFLLFSLLIPYVHREGLIGSEARSGLLALLSLSKKFNYIAQYIADESNFCPVLATGLSGLYSSLPRKIIFTNFNNEWYQITVNDINESPELKQFLSSLDFCNTVIDVSAKSIAKQLIEFILHGFLISVIAPALHQVSTFYFHASLVIWFEFLFLIFSLPLFSGRGPV